MKKYFKRFLYKKDGEPFPPYFFATIFLFQAFVIGWLAVFMDKDLSVLVGILYGGTGVWMSVLKIMKRNGKKDDEKN